MMQSDLDCPILSKKLPLPQNGLQFLTEIVNLLLGILLVRFCPHFMIQTLFLAFFVNRMDKTEKLDNFLFDILPIFLPKSKKILLNILKASLSNFKSCAIKYSCPNKLVLKSFLDTILQSRSLCDVRNRSQTVWDQNQFNFSNQSKNLVIKMMAHTICGQNIMHEKCNAGTQWSIVLTSR